MSSPDNMKEANIGVLAYYKPSLGYTWTSIRTRTFWFGF
jgi:hypothetical protein